MQALLDALAHAISDVGYWRWWDADPPESFQIEFGGTQLRFDPPEEGAPPSGLVALRFIHPVDVVCLSLSEQVPSNWVELLHDDKLEPFNVDCEACAFNDDALLHDLLASARARHVLQGNRDEAGVLARTEISFGFAAHALPHSPSFSGGRRAVGCCITARRMEVHSIHGAVDLTRIPALSKAWWKYWKEYWCRKDAGHPLPEDYACEVTIPAG